MDIKAMLVLSVAIASEVMATTSLKLTEGFTRHVWLAPVAVGYLLAFYLLSVTLKTVPVGVAYAIWSGLGTIGITLVGWWLFKQSLNTPTLIGMTLVLIGVMMMNLSGDAAK